MPGTSRVTCYRSGSPASAMSPQLLRPELFEGVELLLLTGITPPLSRSCADLVQEAAVSARERLRQANACGALACLDTGDRGAHRQDEIWRPS
ncbi:hypothetical protein [Streptomyces sp. NPDC006971]|uniref:hypothetical protein n=1 Tax=Streptomyces sp. NPDC006971 TaxID=3154784 RepID=UPI00340BC703